MLSHMEGCDASILLDGKDSEKTAIPNGSVRGYDLIQAAKDAVEEICPGLVSCADIIALATRDAVALGGGKWYNVETGRKDGNVSLSSNVLLPGSAISVSDSIATFKNKGINATQMVYLLGGHTVGITHCPLFQNRLYNFENTGAADPTMSPWLLSTLRSKCPENTNTNNIADLDVGTPTFVDKSFYQQIIWRNGVLKIDQQIALDPLTKDIVADIAKSSDFGTKFGEAMVELGRVEVLTGTEGEIRRKCNVVNSPSSV